MSDEGHLEEWARVHCPYCGEVQEIDLDPDTVGSFVQDCQVCCRPWKVTVTRNVDGDAELVVDRSD